MNANPMMPNVGDRVGWGNQHTGEVLQVNIPKHRAIVRMDSDRTTVLVDFSEMHVLPRVPPDVVADAVETGAYL